MPHTRVLLVRWSGFFPETISLLAPPSRMDLIEIAVYYPGGGSIAAFLLGAAGNVIRLAMEGWEDVAEFRLVNGCWLSENNEVVEIVSRPTPWACLGLTDEPVDSAPRWVN